MSGRDDGLASRVFDVCVGALLAAMALYGAVQILKEIWLPLCIGMAAIFASAGLIWVIRNRLERW